MAASEIVKIPWPPLPDLPTNTKGPGNAQAAGTTLAPDSISSLRLRQYQQAGAAVLSAAGAG
jgi:hypothetical protein